MRAAAGGASDGGPGGGGAEVAGIDREAAAAFMRVAVSAARRGLGRTSPNPAVGAVVVRDGRIVGRGHHARAGGPHAEVVALRAAGEKARGADLYTTLEPCDHFGRTPPCSLAILEAGVRAVVVGSRDPNPLVRGRGVARLRRHGVPVVRGVLSDECDRLVAPWVTFITKGRPHVTLKAAVTLDGKIATREGDARWISGPEARAWVHRKRNEVDAVLVGAGTARADDPELTTRLPGGGGRDPLRVVLDTRLRLPRRLRLFRQRSAAPTLLAHASGRRRRPWPGVELLRCRRGDGGVDLSDLLRQLAARGVTHLLVEGGAAVHAQFLEEGLVDEVAIFVAPKILGGDGLSLARGRGPARMARVLRLESVRVERLGDDVLVTGRVPRPLAKARKRG
ncbi:MAG TPA: bifunctional diaminohydroxyphosphoribosylaminopyrimidine deaminase/5-amino-6-(5-phosphoribosylamino)uracil reductase RibD [Anaeromyxobacter sp.]|nr:bifunctional diaminohydroxyphosphoribosylaminopyrimidine deaminase/5-amino-6-(5-phosphoribosylamino)uracil reductase RibD [Anaeromyxobacter sp.]